MYKTRQEYLDFFTYMEQEEINDGPLGGQAWDEISWWHHDAVESKMFTVEELKTMFPALFGDFI